MTLTEIADKYFCEKSSICGYTDFYDYFFRGLRDKAFNLFEIGVLGGQSMAMWSEYFPQAMIYGIDTNPHSIRKYGSNIETFFVNQCDKEKLKKLLDFIGEVFIACDDGSHITSDILDSFEVIHPFIARGGFYIIEDVLSESKDEINAFLDDFLKNPEWIHLLKLRVPRASDCDMHILQRRFCD